MSDDLTVNDNTTLEQVAKHSSIDIGLGLTALVLSEGEKKEFNPSMLYSTEIGRAFTFYAPAGITMLAVGVQANNGILVAGGLAVISCVSAIAKEYDIEGFCNALFSPSAS